MQWHPEQHNTSWLRMYLGLALQCNLNVLDAVYCTMPWNKAAVETHLNKQLDKGQIVNIEFRPYFRIRSREHLMWVIVEYINYSSASLLVAPYTWMHPRDWSVVIN